MMSKVEARTYQQEVTQLFCIVATFCQQMERWQDAERAQWLRDVSVQLLQLKQAIEQIPPTGLVLFDEADIQDRFVFFTEMKDWLADLDNYWLAGDRSNDNPELTGSLADDFTDIYFELRAGLAYVDSEADEQLIVAGHWRSFYNLHWAEHLSDALRYVSILHMCQRI